eukprot:scaffold59477_cov34-Prasinocladus_malaysianus.AAC.1
MSSSTELDTDHRLVCYIQPDITLACPFIAGWLSSIGLPLSGRRPSSTAGHCHALRHVRDRAVGDDYLPLKAHQVVREVVAVISHQTGGCGSAVELRIAVFAQL